MRSELEKSQQEKQQIEIQRADEDDKSNLHVPKKLNWQTILYDENIFIDTESFRKWDKSLIFDGEELLEKDIQRTRMNEEYFKKGTTMTLLKRITTFYCVQNRVQYQQGLLEVVIPFALLRRKDFETRKCYAYFNAFMRKFFPRVLTQKIIKNKRQLPHAVLAITLTQILLRFHYPLLYDIFVQQEIPLSMIVTQEILTVFAKNIKIPLVYEIFNFFMNKQNKNYLLYMCIALIGLKQNQIIDKSENDTLHAYVNKNLKNFENLKDLQLWFRKAEEIEKSTPESFELLSKQLGFSEKSFYTIEDFDRMMKLEEDLVDFMMPINRKQIESSLHRFVFIIISGELPSKNYQSIRIQAIQNKKLLKQNQIILIRKVPRTKILVLAFSKVNQELEKLKLLRLMKQINGLTKYGFKFMAFEEKLDEQSSCEIY